MAIAKRVFLFVATNLLVIVTLSVVLNILMALGVLPPDFVASLRTNYGSLFIFCLIFGMGGAFISLQISRWMAKRAYGVQVIDPNTQDPAAQRLVQKVHELSRAANLPAMPEVGFYESPTVNAFATGPSKSKSLVAVSTGLLQKLDDDGVEGVLGHEVAHIANGDMVTMTLLQGIVNAFVMFFARIVANIIDNALRSDDEGGGGLGMIGYIFTVMILETFFMFFGHIVIAWFSRHREFRADAGGARLAGRDKMVSGLNQLKNTLEIEDPHLKVSNSYAFFGIANKPSGFMRLLSTHPPLEDRVRRLELSTNL